MESLQHIDHFGVHLKVRSINPAVAQELIQFSFYYLPVYAIYGEQDAIFPFRFS